MLKKCFLIAIGTVMVFNSAIFATQRTAVLVTIIDHGYSSDSSYYFIKTNEALGGACIDSILYWSTASNEGKSAVCALHFFLNRSTKIRLNYNDSAESQKLVQILEPIR